MQLRHGQAVALMVLVTAMWSIAGVVTRQLEAARVAITRRIPITTCLSCSNRLSTSAWSKSVFRSFTRT